MKIIKTSKGTEKYTGKFRLVECVQGQSIVDAKPIGSFDDYRGSEAALIFETADGLSLYQIVSLSKLGDEERSYAWRMMAILFWNVELKRSRFYGPDGHLIWVEGVDSHAAS